MSENKKAGLEEYERIKEFLSEEDYKIYEESIKILSETVDNFICKLEEHLSEEANAFEFIKNVNNELGKKNEQ